MRRGSVTWEAYQIWACSHQKKSHDISEDHADHRFRLVRLVRSLTWRLENMVISSNWFISHLEKKGLGLYPGHTKHMIQGNFDVPKSQGKGLPKIHFCCHGNYTLED